MIRYSPRYFLVDKTNLNQKSQLINVSVKDRLIKLLKCFRSVTWMPSVDREVSVRTVQPDPTQQHSLNRTLGRAISQTVDFAKVRRILDSYFLVIVELVCCSFQKADFLFLFYYYFKKMIIIREENKELYIMLSAGRKNYFSHFQH